VLLAGMFNLFSEGLNRRGFSGTSRYIGDLERMVEKIFFDEFSMFDAQRKQINRMPHLLKLCSLSR
jgi:hypothetical protein